MNLFKITISALLLSLTASLSSCSDFLKEQSQDEIIPETIEDLAATMYSEAYPYMLSTDLYLSILSDERSCNGLKYSEYITQFQAGTAMFTFNPAMFDGTLAFPEDANSWKTYYEKIKGCNVVLDYVSKVSGTEQEKNALRGQALFLRGFYYLKLALIYCQIYNAEGVNPDQALGVPLVLSMNVTDNFPVRASLKDTYTQIESDLKESYTLLKENYTTASKFRVSYLTAQAMLSRLYLYMGRDEDLQKVIDYSTLVLNEKPALTNLNTFSSSFLMDGIYSLNVSDEPLWVYGSPSVTNSTYIPTGLYMNVPPYTISSSLIALYDDNDLRKQSYFGSMSFDEGYFYYKSTKVGSTVTGYGECGIRTAELYLNRAEAAARLFLKTGNTSLRTTALDDLNKLRSNRYLTGTYTNVDFTDANDLLNFCLQERQRELCVEEGLRWFDIKRLNLSVTHTYIDASDVATDYTLKSGDPLYALPIPYDAIKRNYKLVQNPR